jgi:hypothetical protein
MAAKDDLERLQQANSEGDRTFIYNGVTYRREQFGDLLKQLESLVETEAQAAKTKAEAETKALVRAPKTLAAAQKFLADSQKNFDRVLERYNSGTLSGEAVDTARIQLDTAKETVARLTPSGKTTVAKTTEPVVTPPTGAGKTMQGISGPLGSTATVPPVATDAAGTTTNFKSTVTKQQVTDELTRQGLASTPENRQMVRQQLETGKVPAAGYQAGWEDEVRRQYSQYSWMLDDLDRTKYKDVFDLLAEAVNPQTRITDPELFKTRFESTSWYQELATQQMGRKVRSAVGALSFNPANYAKLLNNAMRFGWEGDNLKAEAYREVFRKNNDGTFANPNAVGEARKSNDYLAIKTIGNAYLSPMSDDRIVDTLTGKTTQDDLLRIYREKAKVSNPHLAAAIDAGVTLEDIAYDYRKAASDVLGVPLAGIPLTEDFFGAALKGGEPGKPRLMTTNEWKFQLKSNPDYGYQFTGNARKEVNDIVANLEKAFGFVQ